MSYSKNGNFRYPNFLGVYIKDAKANENKPTFTKENDKSKIVYYDRWYVSIIFPILINPEMSELKLNFKKLELDNTNICVDFIFQKFT